jgi:hypothetical protein
MKLAIAPPTIACVERIMVPAFGRFSRLPPLPRGSLNVNTTAKKSRALANHQLRLRELGHNEEAILNMTPATAPRVNRSSIDDQFIDIFRPGVSRKSSAIDLKMHH